MTTKRPPFRLRRRQPRRRVKRLKVWLSDLNRKPFPGYSPEEPNGPRYFVTALGRVYRSDGRLVAVDSRLTVKLDKGRKRRSLPLAVLRAFGHKPPTYYASWRPWVDPDGPIDTLTGRTRCAISDLRIVPYSEIKVFELGGPKPSTFYPVL